MRGSVGQTMRATTRNHFVPQAIAGVGKQPYPNANTVISAPSQPVVLQTTGKPETGLLKGCFETTQLTSRTMLHVLTAVQSAQRQSKDPRLHPS